MAATETGKPQDLFVEDVPTEAERKLDRETLRRLDLVLMPMTLILYLLAWLDRANVGNARVVSAGCIQSSVNAADGLGWSGQRSQPQRPSIQDW
jgi:hypothetical protein